MPTSTAEAQLCVRLTRNGLRYDGQHSRYAHRMSLFWRGYLVGVLTAVAWIVVNHELGWM